MRILAIVHGRDAGPGVFEEAILAGGHRLDSWLIWEETTPPDPAGDYDAVMTFGGAMHPDEVQEHPWLAGEQVILARLIEEGVPLLGICLGAELLAAAAGAPVRRAATPEIGWYEVELTPHGRSDPLLGALGPTFAALEWHSYECALPPGGTALASSAACLQAFRVADTAWGIQFHAEVTGEDFDAWLDDYASDADAVAMGLDTGRLRAETRAAIADWNGLGRRLCERFLALAGGP